MSKIIVSPNKTSYSEQGIWVFLNELREIANPKGKPAEDASWLDKLSWFELTREKLQEHTYFEVDLRCRPGDAVVSVVYHEKTLFAIPVGEVSYEPNPTHTSSDNAFVYATAAVNKLLGDVVNEQTNAKYVDPEIKFDPWTTRLITPQSRLGFKPDVFLKALNQIQIEQHPEPNSRSVKCDFNYTEVNLITKLRGSMFIMRIETYQPLLPSWEFEIPMKVIGRSEYGKSFEQAGDVAIKAWDRLIKTFYIKALQAEIATINNTIEEVKSSSPESEIANTVSDVFPL